MVCIELNPPSESSLLVYWINCSAVCLDSWFLGLVFFFPRIANPQERRKFSQVTPAQFVCCFFPSIGFLTSNWTRAVSIKSPPITVVSASHLGRQIYQEDALYYGGFFVCRLRPCCKLRCKTMDSVPTKKSQY